MPLPALSNDEKREENVLHSPYNFSDARKLEQLVYELKGTICRYLNCEAEKVFIIVYQSHTMNNFIISGVGPGMGCSIAREFSSHGISIGLISRTDFGVRLSRELNCVHRKADLKDFESTQKVIDELAEELGGISGVVHCAGGFFSTMGIMETDPEQFMEALENNSVTYFNVAKSSVKHISGKGGSITAISAARNVYYGSNPGYSAGKGSIVYMTRTLAKDLARFNIRVNAVAPGFIRKDDCGTPPGDAKLLGSERYPSSLIGKIVYEIATNSIITGQNIEADGGVSSQIPSSKTM